MHFDFATFLFLVTVLSGFIWGAGRLFEKMRKKPFTSRKVLVTIDYAKSFFPILLFVFLFRSFVFEPYRIPSGSMKPTLLVGDFILVNKYTYGIQLPVINRWIWRYHKPARGDIMVFRNPENPEICLIKRLIGLPGDHIAYYNRQLYINGELVHKDYEKSFTAETESGKSYTMREWIEKLPDDGSHHIYEHSEGYTLSGEWRVPEGSYVMFGDNRDESGDSRVWGLLPESEVIGKAVLIWMSFDSDHFGVRFNRIGHVLQ